MARVKSPSGSKTKKEKNGVGAPWIPGGNPVAAESPVESVNQAVETGVKAQAAAAGAAQQSAPQQPAPVQQSAPVPQSAAAQESRKFELHKAEPRRNVVPINVEDEIRRRAYEIFQQHGPGIGSAAEDWLSAERKVMQRYRQQRA